MRAQDSIDERDIEEQWRQWHAGVTDQQLEDREHDERLARMDRLAERAPHGLMHLAYLERVGDRERRAHFDETRVRALLRPRTGEVSASPRGCPVDEAA